MNDTEILQAIIAANRAGEGAGLASYCTAHADTLRAIFAQYANDDSPILIEATSNQVNQFGGYTNMVPLGFANFIEIIAAGEGVDRERIILGGDHLGPNPWKREPAVEAMAKAKTMVRAYVEAGFSKIHLDASMACADDGPLMAATMADRAAELCAVAEIAAAGRPISYVIGTEVPVPGGETEAGEPLALTKPAAVAETFALHERAFAERGLEGALERVIAMVVQPGVEFSNTEIMGFVPEAARPLAGALTDLAGLAFEAHSTDYQSESSLRAMVANHFALLKVGPELTFAFREAVVRMALMEPFIGAETPSRILDVVAAEMDADPAPWRAYVAPGERAEAMALFGLSDRIRYYWTRPRVAAAVQQLFENIDSARLEIGLISQFLADLDFTAAAHLPLSARLIAQNVAIVVNKYRRATG